MNGPTESASTGAVRGSVGVPGVMQAVRLHGGDGAEGAHLELEQASIPQLQPGDVLVRVHAAAITRDELAWPVDRLPAIPSYEVSGVVSAVAPDVTSVNTGDEVYALTPFDRDGAAAEYVAVPADVLAAKPATLGHVESAAVPMPGLSAWQGLFDMGGLEAGERVLILGARGAVGHLAAQLARERGAVVVTDPVGESPEEVDLVFDTIGGDALARSVAAVKPGGRLVSIAEEPPETGRDDMTPLYFVVEQSRDQLTELARLIDTGKVRPEVDSVFRLTEAAAAFARVHERGKRGKVVLEIP
jgi:NADPH:quinone reductase-like Zn-dependent oxidoreductase